MTGSNFDQSPEDVVTKNVNNGTTEKLEKQADEKFSTDFLNAVRTEKARRLYPERGGDKFKPTWFQMLMGSGREAMDKIRCERRVYDRIQKSLGVKIMMDALKSSGCEIDIRRHIACEVCDGSVNGGYDPYLNQVVVCQNTCRTKGMMQGVLTHEMIHMYDFCRRKLDLTNTKHLACTEIRAANLTHCSFLSAVGDGAASFFTIKQQHQQCVKQRAFASVKAVKDISDEEAWDAVTSVFEKCYADLEPFGRRIRRNSDNLEKAYLNRL